MRAQNYTQASQQTCQLLFKKVTKLKQSKQQIDSQKKISMKQFMKQGYKYPVKKDNNALKSDNVNNNAGVVVYRTPVTISTDSQIIYRNYTPNKNKIQANSPQIISSEKIPFYHSNDRQKVNIHTTPEKNLKPIYHINANISPAYPKQFQNINNLNGSRVIKKFANRSPKMKYSTDNKDNNNIINNTQLQHKQPINLQHNGNRSQYQLMQYLQEQNQKLQKIINQQYLPMKQKYNQLLKQRQESDYLISKLEWKLRQLKKEIHD